MPKHRIKKRYWIPLLGLLLVASCSQMEFLKFRKSAKKTKEFFVKRGLPEPSAVFYEYKDRQMHYVHASDNTKPLLVFVHGSPGSFSACLDYLADSTLRERFQMATVDRPGFGFSGFGREERSLKEQSLSLKHVLEQHRSDMSILVGHSYGGPLIARMAMDYPELVDGLIMVAPSIDPGLEDNDAWWRGPMNALGFLFPPAFITSNKEIQALKGELQAMLPKWKDIEVPVTVLQGEKDRLVPAANADFARKMLVSSRALDVTVLPGMDHFIFWTKRNIVKGKILEMKEKIDELRSTIDD